MKWALKRAGWWLRGGRSHFHSGCESRANSSGKVSSVKKKTKNSTKPTLVRRGVLRSKERGSVASPWIPLELMGKTPLGFSGSKRGVLHTIRRCCGQWLRAEVEVFLLICKRCSSLLITVWFGRIPDPYIDVFAACEVVKRLFSFWVEIRCLSRHLQGIHVPNLSLSYIFHMNIVCSYSTYS